MNWTGASPQLSELSGEGHDDLAEQSLTSASSSGGHGMHGQVARSSAAATSSKRRRLLHHPLCPAPRVHRGSRLHCARVAHGDGLACSSMTAIEAAATESPGPRSWPLGLRPGFRRTDPSLLSP